MSPPARRGTSVMSQDFGLEARLRALPGENLLYVVGEEGLEPSRANAHKILSLARLPIPPLTHTYNKF
jgi:hypothetical protein